MARARKAAVARVAAAVSRAAPQAGIQEVRTPNVPSYRGHVDRERYQAMKKALVAALPRKAPGLTQSRMLDAVWQAVPRALFPTAGQAMWWVKCVQLDLEARGLVHRLASTPAQWVRGGGARAKPPATTPKPGRVSRHRR